MPTPSYRRPLNDKQLFLLHVIHKFRFVTIPIISSSLQADRSVIHDRLERLRQLKYIDRRYESSSKLLQQPAVYFLALGGIQLLKGQNPKLTNSLNNMYKNNIVAEPFRNRCLHLFELYIQLKRWYAPNLNFYSKSELSVFSYFPKQSPDAYFALKTPDGTKEFMLDIYDIHLQQFAIRNKIRSFVRHYEEKGWKGSYPTLLFVCDSPTLERFVQRFTKKTLEISANEELVVKTTTLKALLGSQDTNEPIWTTVQEPDKPTILL